MQATLLDAPSQRGDAEALIGRQRQVLEVVRRHIKARSFPPSRSELVEKLSLSDPSAVDGHLTALEKKGWLETYPSVERGMCCLREWAPLYEDATELLTLDAPAPRRRAAGTKDDSPRMDGFDNFATLFEDRPDLHLWITDDSLDLVGYRSGEIAVLVRDLGPREGDLVVARAACKVLIRRYRRKRSGIAELRPNCSNPVHRSVRARRGSMGVEIPEVVVGHVVATRGGRTNNEGSSNGMD